MPKELRKAIGKTEIIKPLRTTDFARAKRLVALESANADARLESAREKLQQVAKSRFSLASPSDAEVQRLAVEWFIGLEKDSEEWLATEGSSLDPEETAEVIDNLRVEMAVFSGGSKDYRADNGSDHLNRFLAERGIAAATGSPACQNLREVFRRARLANARRQLDRFEGQTFQPGTLGHPLRPAKRGQERKRLPGDGAEEDRFAQGFGKGRLVRDPTNDG